MLSETSYLHRTRDAYDAVADDYALLAGKQADQGESTRDACVSTTV